VESKKLNSAKRCFEESDTKILEKYCGTINYELKKKKSINIALPENKRNSYGFPPLYCEYQLKNKEDIKSFTIETKNSWGEVKMKIEYEDLEEDNELVLGNGDKYIINKPKIITIFFYSNDVRDNPPFSIKISSSSMPINKTIISLISFSGFLIIVIIIIAIIIYRRRMQRRNPGIAIIINNNNINGNNNFILTNPAPEPSDRFGLMNFLNQIKPIKFKDVKTKSKNNKCPIDIEYFTDKSDVFFIPICSHTFHYTCFKEFICKNNNSKELRCPLCKTILFSYNINECYNYPSHNNNV
jgi:hypothetical protein